MKQFFKNLEFIRRFTRDVDNPIEASKSMINSIQRLVGINDVFGDTKRSFSFVSLLSIMVFAGSFVYVGPFSQLIYLVKVFPDKIETFKALNCISATSVPLSKYIFMWKSRNRLKAVIEMCNSGKAGLSTDGVAHATLLRTLRKARYFAWLAIANQFIAHFVYLFAPFIMTLIRKERYLPTTPGDSYGLSPKYETPYFEITYMVTILGTAFSAINQTGYIVLFIIIVSHELGHFYAISETLNNLHETLSNDARYKNAAGTANDENEKVERTLLFCIKHHQFIRNFHAMLQDLYRAIFGAHFFVMVAVLVTTLQTLSSWDLRNTVLTGITGILPLILYCFGGEMLISAGQDIAISLYSCGWEMMAPKQAKIVLLMMCICQRPLYLSAANIFIMNRETFGDVAQVVYKIYTVFN